MTVEVPVLILQLILGMRQKAMKKNSVNPLGHEVLMEISSRIQTVTHTSTEAPQGQSQAHPSEELLQEKTWLHAVWVLGVSAIISLVPVIGALISLTPLSRSSTIQSAIIFSTGLWNIVANAPPTWKVLAHQEMDDTQEDDRMDYYLFLDKNNLQYKELLGFEELTLVVPNNKFKDMPFLPTSYTIAI